MAPHLFGEHAVGVCQNCDALCLINPSVAPGQLTRIVCNDCGQSSELRIRNRVPGQLVQVTASTSLPSRWSPIAFGDSDSKDEPPTRFMVKRLVGLPGESLRIRHGDVWIDGQIARKSLEQYKAMAITIARARGDAPRRWAVWQGSDSSQWTHDSLGLRFDSKLGHETGARLSFAPGAKGLLDDDYLFNAGVSRQLELIRDVWLDLAADLEAESRLQLIARWGDRTTSLSVDTNAGDLTIHHADLDPQRIAEVSSTRPIRCGIGQIDGLLCVTLDESVVWEQTVQTQDNASVSLEVVATGSGLIHQLHVTRDVHYLEPFGAEFTRVELENRACYVLGDNSPLSIDSRHEGPIERDRILGVVAAVPSP